MKQLLTDPFLYLNYAAAIIGILLLRRLKPEKIGPNFRSLAELFLIMILVGACMYMSWQFGNASLDKLGIPH